MIVIDASAVLEILSRSETGIELANSVRDLYLHAPHLLDLEILNAIRRWERSGVIPRGEGAGLLDVFRSMSITRYAHTPLLDSIWALRHNLTAYDAAYLALAKVLDAELVTMDAALRKMASR